MKKIATLLLGLVTAMPLFGMAGDYNLDDLSVSLNTGYTSEYFYRGAKHSHHAMQAKIEMGYPIHEKGQFYVGLWSNHPTTQPFATEVDIYGGMTYLLTDGFSADFGYTHYRHNAGTNLFGRQSTNEIFLGILSDIILNPALYVYYDFDLRQIVTEVSAGYKLDLAEFGLDRWSIDSGAAIGWLRSTKFNAASVTVDYFYTTLRSDLVFMLNDNTSMKIGGKFAANGASGDSAANAFGRSTTMIAFTSSITIGF